MKATSLILERLAALIQQSLREDAARHGLLPIHLQVLQYLRQCNQYSDLPIAIAEYFGITRGTVSQTLSVLERKGLLRKEQDPRHGKRIHLKLTPQGESVLQDSWAERIETALDAQSPNPADTRRLLHGLLQSLQRLNQQRAFGICQECIHHLRESGKPPRCGLTGETLLNEQVEKICREWSIATH
ncbi:MAG: MarR family winged helix-turn-helix transcriptional regulator [Chromatiales bacterium]|nr:winged helix-turn-helix transcriptional regulator [Gammaproteobacteria bacterium]MBW6475622.1 MarR family winged helix-turn-helix transcriptional regulator [Chromatiales bacterium]